MRIGGIVLCGGRSRRMGQPKAWLPFGDELMLPRVVRILREVVEPVVVVAAPGQDVPSLPDEVEIVRDEVEGRGPLAGLAAGLAALKADAAYLSSCDVPFLMPAFVRRMVGFLSGRHQPPEGSPAQGANAPRSEANALRSEGVLVAVPKVEGFHHPLAAVYRVAVLPVVRDLLAADRLRPVFLYDAVPTRIVEPHEMADIDPAFQSLRNLNTPADYEAALRELSPRG